jgi:hypothetical protein
MIETDPHKRVRQEDSATDSWIVPKYGIGGGIKERRFVILLASCGASVTRGRAHQPLGQRGRHTSVFTVQTSNERASAKAMRHRRPDLFGPRHAKTSVYVSGIARLKHKGRFRG